MGIRDLGRLHSISVRRGLSYSLEKVQNIFRSSVVAAVLTAFTLNILVGCGSGSGPSQSSSNLQSITVVPASALVNIDNTEHFSAVGQFRDGSTRTLTAVTWAAANGNIATVDNTGVAVGVSSGITKITASVSGVIGVATITIASPTPPGSSGSSSAGIAGDIAYVPAPGQNCNGNVLSPTNPNTVTVVDLKAKSTTSAVLAHIAMPANYIPTATAANYTTDQVLVTSCTSPTVLIIDGTSNKIVGSADAPITETATLSGGSCIICGVAFDLTANKAVLDTAQGLMMFDLNTKTFTAPVPGSSPSENFGYDPARQLVLNPIYTSAPAGFQVVDLAANSSMTFTTNVKEPDAGAIDSVTHIGLITDEASNTELFVNLNGSPGATPAWTSFAQQTACAELTMAAIDSSVHMAVLAAENEADCFALELLPTTAPRAETAPGTPSMFLWGHMPQTPNGHRWRFGLDPHGLAVFTSSLEGKHYAFLVDKNANWVARIDLVAVAGATPNSAGIDLSPYVTFLQAF